MKNIVRLIFTLLTFHVSLSSSAYGEIGLASVNVPAGTDLSLFINEVKEQYNRREEITLYLEPGEYALSSAVELSFNQRWIICGDNAAKIVFGETASFIICGGFVLDGVTIDASAQTKSKASIIELSSMPSYEIKGLTGKDYYNILDSVSIKNCKLEGVNGYLLYDNSQEYCLNNFLIENTVIHLTTNVSELAYNAIINVYGGGIAHFKMENSTMWSSDNELEAKYFLRYNNSFREDRVFDMEKFPDASLEVALVSCTFYNSFKNGHIANYDGIINRAATSFNMTKCIFVDCGSGQIPRRFIRSVQPNPSYTWLYNTYWYDGASEVREDGTGAADYDKSGTILSTDPAFVDPEHGDFTPTGSEQLQYGTGDPRWLTGGASIANVDNTERRSERLFNAQGLRVSNSYKGIIIRKGQKILVK